MVKVVIGLTGTIGAGKDIVREYLKQKFNCFYVKLSEILKNEIEKKRGKLSRKLMQDSGDEMRRKYGTHILAKVAIDYLPRNKELIVIDGIRNLGEIDYLRKNFGKNFVLIAIDSKPELRFERLKKRARIEDPKTWEEFLEMDARDQGIDQPDYGQQTRKCIDKADFIITNNGSLEEFQTNISETLKKIEEQQKF